MRVLMILSTYKQAKSEWILGKILRLEMYTQNALNAFIETMSSFYYACMWLQMKMCTHKLFYE
jgi:hypothetical protein